MIVGRVSELWRYPVKSMAGERLDEATVDPTYGIPGDRAWALRDDTADEIRGAKKLRELLDCTPRYLDEPAGAASPPVEITLPDASVVSSSDPRVHEVLSAVVGRAVSLWPRRPATDVAFYRRRAVTTEAALRDRLGLLPDEPMPGLGGAPEEMRRHLAEFVSPLGTYFDAYPLSLVTTSSMRALADASSSSTVDSRRFRQNIVVDTGDADGFVEGGWVGRQIRIGELVTTAAMQIPRCVIITHPQAELPQDRSLMRTLVARTGQMFGIYLQPAAAAQLRIGDPVELVEPVELVG